LDWHEGKVNTYTTRITTNGIVAAAVDTQVAIRVITLHSILKVKDVVLIIDQIDHVLGCRPARCVLGDITAETAGVVVQSGAVLSDDPWNLETGEDGAEVDGEAATPMLASHLCSLDICTTYFLNGPEKTQPPPFPGVRTIPGAASEPLCGMYDPSPDIL
jgi:hypothetical protein